MVNCNFCRKEAIYLRPYSGERYCKKCFQYMIEKKVQRTISKRRMLRPDSKIAIALSGGKDSVSLLHMMTNIEKKLPLSEIFAVTIDEGISGYRSEAIKIARENCKMLNVEHHVYSFKKIYGHTIDDIAVAARAKGKNFICSYCGILRRKALNIATRELGARKLVTAHNLDDEVQSMLMNLLRGDLNSLSKKEFYSEEDRSEDAKLIPRVKPLSELPEREVALYAFLKDIRLQTFTCSYLETSLRSDVRNFLNMMEQKHTGMKFTLYRSLSKIQRNLRISKNRNLGLCKVCGESAAKDVCMACQTLKDLDFI